MTTNAFHLTFVHLIILSQSACALLLYWIIFIALAILPFDCCSDANWPLLTEHVLYEEYGADIILSFAVPHTSKSIDAIVNFPPPNNALPPRRQIGRAHV